MTLKKLRQINALADAILRKIKWRQNMMQLKQDVRIKRMLKRQLLSRMNSKRRLSN